MKKSLICAMAIAVVSTAAGGNASASVFTPGGLFFASNNVNHGTIYDISGGGDFSGATAFADGVLRNDGQMTWSADRSTMYATTRNSGIINAVDASGEVSTYFDGFTDYKILTGIVQTQNGRLLVASYLEGKVYDVTNPANVTTHAEGMSYIRNLLELPSGEILAGGNGKIWDISSGAPTVWATMPGWVADMDYTSTGSVYATVWEGTSSRGIYDVTGGGIIDSYDRFAWTDYSDFRGLAIDRRTDQILAAPAYLNMIVDVTSGGCFQLNDPSQYWAYNIPTTSDAAFDFVPFSASVPEPATLVIWSLLGLCGFLWHGSNGKSKE